MDKKTNYQSISVYLEPERIKEFSHETFKVLERFKIYIFTDRRKGDRRKNIESKG